MHGASLHFVSKQVLHSFHEFRYFHLEGVHVRREHGLGCLASSSASLGEAKCFIAYWEEWLWGSIRFSMGRAHPNILWVELEALKHGLLLAWERGYKAVWCETGCLEVEAYHLLQSTMPLREVELYNLVRDIRYLLDHEWKVQLKHEFRTANLTADLLAKVGAKEAVGWRE